VRLKVVVLVVVVVVVVVVAILVESRLNDAVKERDRGRNNRNRPDIHLEQPIKNANIKPCHRK
jgi:hypothetical protein